MDDLGKLIELECLCNAEISQYIIIIISRRNLINLFFILFFLEQKTKNIYLDISKEPETANFPALAVCKTFLHFLNYDTCMYLIIIRDKFFYRKWHRLLYQLFDLKF
jgi:hypothetical protein